MDASLAETSNTLFTVAFIAYLAAMVAYFFRLAFTKVGVGGTARTTTAGLRAGGVATALTVGGAVVHLGSLVSRGLAQGHVPWSNMYEYSSSLALLTVVVGLVAVQRRMGYGHLMGFVLALGVLAMTSGLLLFAEAGPLAPSLQSWWINVHTSSAMVASSIFFVGFMATTLYLVKSTAEERAAAAEAGQTPKPAGAAPAPPGGSGDGRDGDGDGPIDDYVAGELATAARAGRPEAQRETLSPVWFPGVPFVIVVAYVLWVWRTPVTALIAGSVAALLGIAVWYAVPKLPPAAKLDLMAYRLNAFAFPIWTFAVIAGAIWAQEAWGRYWGWDPKETGAFFTWVLYAGYLHARSTRGWRGRKAAWVGVVAFVALAITYYAVNLFVVGLHSYAGV